MRRRLNFRLLAILVIAGVALGVGIHVGHGFQVQRSAGVLLKLSGKAEASGDSALAAKHLGRYLILRPDDGEAQVKYALTLESKAKARSDRMQALAALEKVLRSQPDRHDLRRKAIRLALDLGKYSDARAHLDYLTTAKLDDGELLRFAGQCAIAASDFTTAADRLEESITRDPRQIESYVLLAVVLRVRLKQPERADEFIDRMVAQNDGSYQAHLERWRYRVQYRPPGDVQDVRRAMELAPDDTDVVLVAAEEAEQRGDLDAARKHLERGLKRHARERHFYQALGGLESRAKRPEEAIAVLNRGIEAIPDEAQDLRVDLIDTLIQARRPEEARRQIARLRKVGEASPLLDVLEAGARIVQQDYLGAISLLKYAHTYLSTAGAPKDMSEQGRLLLVQANLLLGQCYAQTGAFDLALSSYQRVLEIDPRSLPARRGLAAAQGALGRLDQALPMFEGIAAESPEGAVEVARLTLAKALQAPTEPKRWADVDRALERAETAAPGSVNVSILRAEVLALQNQVDRARTLLEEARTRHADRVEPWIALATLAERQKGPDAALALLDEARTRLGDRADLRLARARVWTRRGGAGAKEALAQLGAGLEAFPEDDRARLLGGLAAAFYQVGDQGPAEKLWGELARLRPEDTGLRTVLFDLALRAGDEAAMERAVREIKAIEGETGTLWRYAEASLLVTKARRGDKQGLDQARARLTEIAAQRPNWSRVPLLEAQINELEGNTERAIEGYRQAIQLGDPGTLAARQLVLLLYRLNRIDEADRVISRLADKSPLMAGTLGQVAAELSLRNKDYERALELAQRSVRADAAEYRDRIWLALVQAASGKPDDALATLRLAVQVAGDVPDVWVALVQQMARMGLKSDAEAAIREAQAKLPPARAPLALALCYELIGSPDRAEKSYQEVLKAQPDDLALLERVTSFYIQAQRPRQAEPLLRRMLDPKLGAPATALARTRRNLAIVLADRGTQPQFQEALALIEANLQGGTKSDDDLRVRATVLASQPARRREAIQIFEEIGRRREPSPADRLLLFGLYSDTGDWDRARTLMQALVAEHGDEPIYLVSFVGRLIERGDLAEAKPLVDKLEELEPAAYRAKELRARLLKADGQADQAAALLKSAAREPGTAPPIVRIAVLLDGWGRPADAEEMYRLLVERSSQPESALLLIDFLSRTGRSDEALDLCDRLRKTSTLDVAGGAYLSALGPDVPDERAAQRAERALTELNGSHPESPMLPIHLAVLKYRQGQYEDSEAIYRRLLQRNDRHVAALNNLAWLLAQRGRGGDEPLRLIDRALEIGGKLPALLDTRGLVCLVLGRTDEAIQDLEQATAQAPDGNVYFHLARAYQQAEKRAAASDAFRKAQSLGVRPDPLERPVYDRLLALLGPK